MNNKHDEQTLEELYLDVDFNPDYKRNYADRYKSLHKKIAELQSLLSNHENTPFSGDVRKAFYACLKELESLADKFDRDSFNLWAESDAEDTKDNKHS